MLSSHNQGFSLIEAMISLLVLSTGMLSLGQLQARLWLNADEIHTHDEARLLAANRLEFEQSKTLFRPATEETLIFPTTDNGSALRHEITTSAIGAISTNEILITWELPHGSDAVSLKSSLYTTAYRTDPRWLMN
ncbi:hypothetical protein MNBD_GAMMA13-367 [hydrothermal vent metagenome]|uniref:Prepilin-type N-terminal cleavage/methylation domain-containing protein n=1 Tax=hydrothermal vent metagenome TaxID=652676 RepID=A0A3B0YGL3_9ZZZZ